MRVLILLALSLAAAACSAPPTAVDANFGQALTSAKAAQVVDPDAPTRVRPPMTTDAQAVKSAVDGYQKSFEMPPPPVQVFNIGVGGGSR